MAGCECGQSEDYRQCCRPLHQGLAVADTPSRLVRARFCAFARKEVAFLWKTLHSTHDERARPEADVLKELRASCSRYRYARLYLLQSRGDEVLFLAEIYDRGKERSFVERSLFVFEEGGWKYVSGVNSAWSVKDVSRAEWTSPDVQAGSA